MRKKYQKYGSQTIFSYVLQDTYRYCTKMADRQVSEVGSIVLSFILARDWLTDIRFALRKAFLKKAEGKEEGNLFYIFN